MPLENLNTAIGSIRKTEWFGTENPEAEAAVPHGGAAVPRSGGALFQNLALELGILFGNLLRHLPALRLQAGGQGVIFHR